MPVGFAAQARLPAGWGQRRAHRDRRGRRDRLGDRGREPRRGGPAAGPVIPAMRQPAHPRLPARHGRPGRSGATRPGDDFWTWREVMYRFLDRLDAGRRRGHRGPALRRDARGRLHGASASSTTCTTTPTGGPMPIRRRWRGRIARGARRRRHRPDPAAGALHPLDLRRPRAQPRAAPLHPDRLDRYLRDGLGPGRRGRRASTSAISVHSLRAVTPEQIADVWRSRPMTPDPHPRRRADQGGERLPRLVGRSGRCEWLLDNVGLNDSWRLVHATHMSKRRGARRRAAGAVAGLCPTTEANLGDGFFQADAWFAANGAIGLGTDSHVTIDPREELRWFDYGRRLQHRKRGLSQPRAPAQSRRRPVAGRGARPTRGAAASRRAGSSPAGAPTSWCSTAAIPTWPAGRATPSSTAWSSSRLPGPSPIAETWVGGTAPDPGRPPSTRRGDRQGLRRGRPRPRFGVTSAHERTRQRPRRPQRRAAPR